MAIASVTTLLYVCLAVVNLNTAFLLNDNTCSGRCGQSADSNLPCQCNSVCQRYNDCCADYSQICNTTPAPSPGSSCSSVSTVTEQLWAQDVNRLPDSAFLLNYQGHVTDGSSTDAAAQRFFTNLNEADLDTPIYRAYRRLLDNYDPVKGVTETPTPAETQEVNDFLDKILATTVMSTLLDNLKCRGIVNSQSELRAKLHKMWFEGFPRSGNAVNPDTSGFEHVMVGEYKSSSVVNGFHGWLSFYLKERAGELNYRGYVKRKDPRIVGASFTWNGRSKALATFLVGTSPEFEMALYSLCVLLHPNASCRTSLDGHDVTIRSYSSSGHVATVFIT